MGRRRYKDERAKKKRRLILFKIIRKQERIIKLNVLFGEKKKRNKNKENFPWNEV